MTQMINMTPPVWNLSLTLFQFLLISRFISGTQKGKDDTRLRIYAHSGDNDFTAALHDMSARQHHGIKLNTFFHMIRFTSQGGFINLIKKIEKKDYYDTWKDVKSSL